MGGAEVDAYPARRGSTQAERTWAQRKAFPIVRRERTSPANPLAPGSIGGPASALSLSVVGHPPAAFDLTRSRFRSGSPRPTDRFGTGTPARYGPEGAEGRWMVDPSTGDYRNADTLSSKLASARHATWAREARADGSVGGMGPEGPPSIKCSPCGSGWRCAGPPRERSALSLPRGDVIGRVLGPTRPKLPPSTGGLPLNVGVRAREVVPFLGGYSG